MNRRRAVSPVVASLFLFAVILGAIAVSLGIVYPNVQRLNDKIEIETAGISLITLDRDLENLIKNGADSKLLTNIDTGQTGAIQIDQTSISNLQVYDGPILVSSLSQNISHNRIQIIQGIDRNVIEPFTHRYLTGGGQQDQIFLNQSRRNTIQWEIVNQSRPTSEHRVYTSLSYRNLVESKTDLEFSIPSVNVTLQFSIVNFTIPTNGVNFKSRTDQLDITYLGMTTRTTKYLEFNNSLRVEAITTLSDPGSVPSLEKIYREEAPVEQTVKFFVRLRFVFHEFQIIL